MELSLRKNAVPFHAYHLGTAVAQGRVLDPVSEYHEVQRADGVSMDAWLATRPSPKPTWRGTLALASGAVVIGGHDYGP